MEIRVIHPWVVWSYDKVYNTWSWTSALWGITAEVYQWDTHLKPRWTVLGGKVNESGSCDTIEECKQAAVVAVSTLAELVVINEVF